jgi:L-serine dehydratase
MNLSIFDVLGPIMIGPSSSHTAGAARLARVAALIAGRPVVHASFGLHGSFAKTGRGHGTDRALVAGILGIHEDDERLSSSFEIAKKHNLTFDFYQVELQDMHENSVLFTLTLDNGEKQQIAGSSIGGGQILITRINGFVLSFSAQSPTLLVRQHDQRGVISGISSILARNNINIATMNLSRQSKGMEAFTVIETDQALKASVLDAIRAIDGVHYAQSIDPCKEAE